MSIAGIDPTRRAGYWCERPKVESHATEGVTVTRAESRGSTAGTVVVAFAPEGPLARVDSKTSKRTPGTISTRGAMCQTVSACAPAVMLVGGGAALEGTCASDEPPGSVGA